MNWYLLVLKRYFVFQERASRSEYWWFVLMSILVFLVLSTFDNLLGWADSGSYSFWYFSFSYHGVGLLGKLYLLAVLIPSIAVTVRRLHDTDRSAWWLLLWFVPFLGSIVLFVFMLTASQAEANRYGPVPVREPAA